MLSNPTTVELRHEMLERLDVFCMHALIKLRSSSLSVLVLR